MRSTSRKAGVSLTAVFGAVLLMATIAGTSLADEPRDQTSQNAPATGVDLQLNDPIGSPQPDLTSNHCSFIDVTPCVTISMCMECDPTPFGPLYCYPVFEIHVCI